MKTITVDILNEKAIKLLEDLEGLKLIRLREKDQSDKNWLQYKGAITKQDINEVDKQLTALRKEWD